MSRDADYRILRFIKVLLVLLCAACSNANVDQACRPELQTGCPQDKFCTITKAGDSVCIDRELGRVNEGAICESFTSSSEAPAISDGVCAPGLACVQDGDVARCLALCDAAADVVQACQVQDFQRHVYAAQSRCAMRVSDRPEIGLCKLPCLFGASGEDGGCPEGTSCGLRPDDRQAQCLVDGHIALGGACSPNCMCSAGLVCVPEANRSACRSSLTVSGCGDTHFLEEVEGSVDPLSQSDAAQAYAYCTRCTPLMVPGTQSPVWLCAGETGCELGKTLAHLPEVELTQLAQILRSKLGSTFQVVLGLERRQDQWFWPGDDNAQSALNDGDGDCPTLNEGGHVIIEPTCPEMSLCQAPTSIHCGFATEVEN